MFIRSLKSAPPARNPTLLRLLLAEVVIWLLCLRIFLILISINSSMSSISPSLLSLNKNLGRDAEESTLSSHRCMENSYVNLLQEESNALKTHIIQSRMKNVSICKLNVKGYKLKELVAKISGDFVVIRGSHSKKKSHRRGLTLRTFTRRVAIPKDVIQDEIKVHLNSNGILLVTGKKCPEYMELPVELINLLALKEELNQPFCRPNLNHLSPSMLNTQFSSFLEQLRKSAEPSKL